ncbi:MAG: hypothetical protein ABIG99_02055, partial [Patescibacteria group bacterium]
MWNFLKNKIIILFFVLSIIFFMPVHTARANGLVDFLTGGVSALLEGRIDILGYSITSFFLDPFSQAILCGTGVLCSGDSGGVTVLPPVVGGSTVEGGCYFKIPVTFYNPRMNVGYTSSTNWFVTKNSDGETINVSGPYYSNAGCSTLISDPTNQNTHYAKYTGYYCGDMCDISGASYVNNSCVRLTKGTTSVFSDASFNETNRQIAIYRFTLSDSSSQATLNDWFVNQIPAAVGDGWMDLPIDKSLIDCSVFNCEDKYKTSSESTKLVTLDYAELCVGNVCTLNDATVPNNSYIAYVAKILGNYSYLDVNLVGGQDGYYVPFLSTKLNKFFNNNNAVGAYFPPYNNTLGNAIVGPYQVGTPDCPVCDNGANNYPDCNTCTTPLKWSVLSSSCVDT